MTWHYPIKSLILSHSSKSTFRSCARKLEFKKFYGDSLRDESGYPANIGKALHAGYQEFLVSRDEDRAIMAMLRKFPYEDEFTKPANATRSLEATFSTLEAMIHHPSATKYQLVDIACRDGVTRPGIEVPFAIEITGCPLPIPVYFVGFIDSVMYDSHEYGYFANDIKTTRQWANDFSARYEFDEQTVPYGMILEHALGHEMDDLHTNYLMAFVDLLEPQVQSYWFKKTKEHLQDWLRGLCDDIDRLAAYSENQFFPRATNGEVCFAYKSKCEFLEYCSFRDPGVIYRMIGEPNVREGFFADGQEPWIMAQLPYIGNGRIK